MRIQYGGLVLAIFLIAGCSPVPGAGRATSMDREFLATAHTSAHQAAMTPYIFVSDFADNAVDIFTNSTSPLLVATITQGINAPEQITFDQNRTLYVTNVFVGTVTEYLAGQHSPSVTLQQDLVRPSGVAVASDGTVFVSNDTEKEAVVAFKPGQMRPFEKIQRIHYALGLAVDEAGNLFVAASKGIFEVPQGSSKPKKLRLKGVASAFGVAVDHDNDIFVATCETSQSGTIFAYRSGETEPYKTLGQGEPCPYFVGIGLKQALFSSYVSESTVAAYRPGSGKPYLEFNSDLNEPVSATSETWPSL